MEVIGVVTGIGGLVGAVGKIIVSANNLRERFEIASQIVPAIVAECESIQKYLNRIKAQLERQAARFLVQDEEAVIIQNLMASCSVLVNVLSEDLEQINVSGNSTIKLGKRTRIQLIWNESRRNQLLNQLRSQCHSLDLLLKAVQQDSLEESRRILHNSSNSIHETVIGSLRLASTSANNDPSTIETGSIFRFVRRNATFDAGAPTLNSATASMTTGFSVPARASEVDELFDAIRGRNYGLLQILIESGADTSVRNERGHSPLSEAVHLEDLEASKLLTADSLGIEARCYNAECLAARPIHIAAQVNSVEIIKLLIEKGADYKALTTKSWSVMHWTAKHDSPDAALFLHQNEVPLNVPDIDGNYPVHIAVLSQSEAWLKTMLDHKELPPAWVIEAKNRKGKLPLQVALETGWITGFRMLSQSGSRLDIKDQNNATLLHDLARRCVTDILQDLLRAGVSVNSRDALGRTPLHHAVMSEFDSRRIIRILHDNGADIDAKAYSTNSKTTDTKDTQDAKETQDTKDIQDTKDLKESKQLNGPTALLLAAEAGKANIVRCLLDAGANVRCANSCGCTILKSSRKSQDLEIFRMLSNKESETHGALHQSQYCEILLALASASAADFEKVHQKVLNANNGSSKSPPNVSSSCSTCGPFSLQLFESTVEYCKSKRFDIFQHNRYLGKTVLSYLTENRNESAVQLVLILDSSKIALDETKKIHDDLPKQAPSTLFEILENAHGGVIKREKKRQMIKQKVQETSRSYVGWLIFSCCYVAALVPLWKIWGQMNHGEVDLNARSNTNLFTVAVLFTTVGACGWTNFGLRHIFRQKALRALILTLGILAALYCIFIIPLWMEWIIRYKTVSPDDIWSDPRGANPFFSAAIIFTAIPFLVVVIFIIAVLRDNASDLARMAGNADLKLDVDDLEWERAFACAALLGAYLVIIIPLWIQYYVRNKTNLLDPANAPSKNTTFTDIHGAHAFYIAGLCTTTIFGVLVIGGEIAMLVDDDF